MTIHNHTKTTSKQLFIAQSWIQQWDSQNISNKKPQSNIPFFTRGDDGRYSVAQHFHFNNLILGGKFPVLTDPLGGLDAQDTAVMDVLDPKVEKIDHVHIDGISQILIDINLMTSDEASYLKGDTGIDRVLQSNIGGPKEKANSLYETASKWVSGEQPGCACLICDRVPNILNKLTQKVVMSPNDVLPLTTIPNLHHVVDNMLEPKIKFALGSQGRIGENSFQEYPSAAVGHAMYPKSDIKIDGATFELPKVLDPKKVMNQNNAPENYAYAKGIFWENGIDMQRLPDDPDQHAFGFVYIHKKSLSKVDIDLETNRFKPRMQ